MHGELGVTAAHLMDSATRMYAPAYLGPDGGIRVIGTETAYLPGAVDEVRQLNADAHSGDAEVFVAFHDVPAWRRLEPSEADPALRSGS